MDPAAFRHLVDEVKRRTDIVELIGRDIELRPAGSHLVGSSPWNRDSNPSFVVWPDSQRWEDFSRGGNGGGDCITYVQGRDGVGFMDALRLLDVAPQITHLGEPVLWGERTIFNVISARKGEAARGVRRGARIATSEWGPHPRHLTPSRLTAA